MYRDFQTRLQTKHDKIKQKLLDNAIELMGQVTDCIRLRLNKNDEGDIISRTVIKMDVLGVVFPPLVDVPYRVLDTKDGGKTWGISPLVAATEDESTKYYQLVMPHSKDVRVGDLIIRVFLDPEMAKPVVLALEVVESLGTFGINSVIQHKYNAVVHMENLPQAITDAIVDMAHRRMKLKF
jgi:hypothetical protein